MKNMPDRLTQRLAFLMKQMPESERARSMARCERLANGHLNTNPDRRDPQTWAEEIFSDLGMRQLAEDRDAAMSAMGQESPEDFVTSLCPALDRLVNKLESLLLGLPPEDRSAAMLECAQAANGHLQSAPRCDSPAALSQHLFEDSGMKHLVRQNPQAAVNALGAESPGELVSRLLPSDGHLE